MKGVAVAGNDDDDRTTKSTRHVWQCPSCRRKFSIPVGNVPLMCPECLLAGRSLANTRLEPTRVLGQALDYVRSNSLQSTFIAVSILFVGVFWMAVREGKKTGNNTQFVNSPQQFPVPNGVTAPLATNPTPSPISLNAASVQAVPDRGLAKDAQPEPTVLSPKEVFNRVAPAVVSIETRSENGEPLCSGTGFFVDERGTIITNAHVIAVTGASQVVVKTKNGEERVIASVSRIDAIRDLASLKFPGPVPSHLTLQPLEPPVGERAFAIGNPVGLERSLSEGIVSGIRQTNATKFIQTTAPVSPGNSGGPLVDSSAKVVGVMVLASRHEVQNINFAISADDVTQFMANKSKTTKIKDVPAWATTVAPATQPIVRVPSMTDVLRGVTGVQVFVSELQPDSRAAGLSESKLNTMVKDALSGTGIEIWDDKSKDRLKHPRQPILVLTVSTIATVDKKAYGYVVELQLMEFTQIFLSNEPGADMVFTPVWITPMIYGSATGSEVSRLARAAVTQQLAAFVADWKKGNNK